VPYESVRTLYPALSRSRPGSVRLHVTSAEFFDIGTPADYLRTSLLLSKREGHQYTARIDATARIESSILWDDVEVEEGAMLRECIVTDGVRVPVDTSWTGVTIRNATTELAPGERRVDGLAICSL
jgi:NDP-sugar pyrophosphorylase family protein